MSTSSRDGAVTHVDGPSLRNALEVAAADLVARTTAASGVPLVPDDRAALVRTAHLVESATADTEDGDAR